MSGNYHSTQRYYNFSILWHKNFPDSNATLLPGFFSLWNADPPPIYPLSLGLEKLCNMVWKFIPNSHPLVTLILSFKPLHHLFGQQYLYQIHSSLALWIKFGQIIHKTYIVWNKEFLFLSKIIFLFSYCLCQKLGKW